ncbi:MAG: hypothetical protein JSS66_02065 [Armatimonadetes bacterium]|nr:hypothetical protein [Armatimonadota bacterium]
MRHLSSDPPPVSDEIARLTAGAILALLLMATAFALAAWEIQSNATNNAVVAPVRPIQRRQEVKPPVIQVSPPAQASGEEGWEPALGDPDDGSGPDGSVTGGEAHFVPLKSRP